MAFLFAFSPLFHEQWPGLWPQGKGETGNASLRRRRSTMLHVRLRGQATREWKEITKYQPEGPGRGCGTISPGNYSSWMTSNSQMHTYKALHSDRQTLRFPMEPGAGLHLHRKGGRCRPCLQWQVPRLITRVKRATSCFHDQCSLVPAIFQQQGKPESHVVQPQVTEENPGCWFFLIWACLQIFWKNFNIILPPFLLKEKIE